MAASVARMETAVDSKWIVRAYNVNAGGLRWRYSTFEANVFHPSCPELCLGFACSPESHLRSDDLYSYGSGVYSKEEFVALAKKTDEETISRALQEARANLAKLKIAEDYDQFTTNL
jgi:hypothetical protein